ncbi:aldehyde dehydrogenase family protein [Nonomuraea rubra]|uniref:aldehyde dehydrogenase family protein n=1 Tax=Nonomuraea rubra TaxID=46180 RepID=UPI0035ECA251
MAAAAGLGGQRAEHLAAAPLQDAGGAQEDLLPLPRQRPRPPGERLAGRGDGPVAPVTRVSSAEEAAELAAAGEYGLSLGIVTRDVMRGLAVAERIPTGIVHINDQTVNDEANAPFGGVRASGTGSRFGGAAANVEAFTETCWITLRGEPPRYPF